jgi:uncharacterized membrane protein YdjX (TVP38/TMEM64 family)
MAAVGSDCKSASDDELRRRSALTWLVPLALLGALVIAYLVSPALRQALARAWAVLSSGDQAQIRTWVEGYGVWGVLVLAGLMILQLIMMFVPSTLVEVAAVLAYGPVWGALLAWAGAMLVAAVGYGLGRAFGPPVVDRLLGGRTRSRVESAVDRYGFWGVALVRFSPLMSSDAVSLVAGLARMSPVRFFVATGLGMLPFVVILAAVGGDLEGIEAGLVGVTALSLVAFAAYVIRDRRERRDRDAASPKGAGEAEAVGGATGDGEVDAG